MNDGDRAEDSAPGSTLQSAEDGGISTAIPIANRISATLLQHRRKHFNRWIKRYRTKLLPVLLNKCNAKCGWCGRHLEYKALGPERITFDHIVPLCFGGKPISRDNLRLVHLKCNGERGNSAQLSRVTDRSGIPDRREGYSGEPDGVIAGTPSPSDL